VKTDRREAEKLARCYRNGDLTPVWVPDAAHEALRDLVRAREDAKQDGQRARQRLGKFLLRHGRQAPADIKEKWTAKYMTWLHDHVQFEQPALEATLVDYVHEVHHAGERIARLEQAIDEAIANAPEQIRSVIAALQALRGVAQMTALRIRNTASVQAAIVAAYSTGRHCSSACQNSGFVGLCFPFQSERD
jgi:transposase